MAGWSIGLLAVWLVGRLVVLNSILGWVGFVHWLGGSGWWAGRVIGWCGWFEGLVGSGGMFGMIALLVCLVGLIDCCITVD